ncbi:MAG: ABC transporter permease [Woeseiaceae bacterium]|nr:ABC transporter permease [Woeseiaceae bacterium]
MFLYNLRLARLSLMKQPLLTGLMVLAIGVGVGACMTILTFVYSLTSDPIPEKSDQLFAVRLDSWGPDEPYDDRRPDEAPWQLTHADAMALLESPVPTRHAAMRKAVFTAVPENRDVAPFLTLSRMTGGAFFDMFNVPFLFGGTWDEDADRNAENVVVLSKETNDSLFGGENSVGREARFGDDVFRVVGVIDEWQPIVLYYDVNNGPNNDVEDVFMPYTIGDRREIDMSGNVNCWKDEQIDTYFDLMQSECVVTQFWAELENEAQVAEYQSWLDRYTEGQKALGRFERPTNNRLSTVTEYMKIREVAADEILVVMSIGVLFLAACMFNTIGIILARFIAKAPVIGLRRALGASKAAIFRQHLVEVGVVGLAGGILGLLLSMLGLAGVRAMLSDGDRAAHLNLELVLIAIVIAVSSAIIAGLYPTWRICQLAPAGYLKTQ